MTEPPRSLLIIKPGSMGDVIHALPVAAAIHNAWPETEITWIVDPRWKTLLNGNPTISRIHTFPREQFRGVIGKFHALRWFCELPQLKPNLVVDLQGLLRSALMAKFTGVNEIHGLRDAREGASFFYTAVSNVGATEHAVNRYLKCLPALGIPIPDKPEFPISSKKTPRYADLSHPYIVLHPFARGRKKSLSLEALNGIIVYIAKEANLKLIVVGMGKAPSGLSNSAINLVGQTSIEELIGLFRQAQFVVSVDSGPMHLASALGVPLLGIHTWSDPRLVGPYNESAWIWQGGEIRQQDLMRKPLPEQVFSTKSAEDVAKFVMTRIS